MCDAVTISPHVIEGLYCEALELSDEVRGAFTLSGTLERGFPDDDLARVALSSEGLRTTTRMMHAIAWLLNRRAFFMGEITEFQLRRHGRLSPAMQESDPEQVARLEPPIAELVEATRSFYARLLRLDRAWRLGEPDRISAVEELRGRIEERLAG